MCLSDMSNCELLLFANNLSLSLTNNLNADDTALLGAFLTVLADQVALIAVKKAAN